MLNRTWTRRRFLSAALPAAALPLLPRGLVASNDGGAWVDTLHVGLLLPVVARSASRVDSVRRGVDMGAAEAARTASLFGLDVRLHDERAADAGDTRDAAQRLLSRGVSALVGGLDDESCRVLTELSTRQGVPFLDVACGAASDAEGASCSPSTFHIWPSASTVRAARAAYARRPDAGVDLERIAPALWHHSLRRFGAEQLNERFRRQFGAEMDSLSWAGWVAVKVLGEAALRVRSVVPARLARQLRASAARFDGHKGEPLSFDRRTQELRQPLYILVDGETGSHGQRVVAELRAADVFGAGGGDARECAAPAPTP